MVIASQVGTTCSLLHNAGGRQRPQLKKIKIPALWATESRQGHLPRGSRIWGGLSEGTGVDQSTIYIENQAPASPLKNPPLLRFEKLLIVICWFCLGPVRLSTSGSERRERKMC